MSTSTTPAIELVNIDGANCYRIALIGKGEGQHCIIDAEDWHRLRALGFSDRLTITGGGQGYVTFTYPPAGFYGSDVHRYTPAYLGRAIMNPSPDEFVSPRNGNRRDFRRSNLVLKPRSELPWKSLRGTKRSAPELTIADQPELLPWD